MNDGAPSARRLRSRLLWTLGVAFVVVQLVRSVFYGSHFTHFTAWNWTLTGLTLLVCAASSRAEAYARQYLLPVAWTVSATVSLATTVMCAENFDVVRKARAEYGDAVVFTVSIILHNVPWLLMAVLVVYAPAPSIDQATCGLLASLMLTLTYLTFFDVQVEYGTGNISTSTAHAAMLAATFVCFLWYWWTVSFRPD
jgi:hypothetical protein